MGYVETSPPPRWDHGLLVPVLSFHLGLMCEPILLDFGIDLP